MRYTTRELKLEKLESVLKINHNHMTLNDQSDHLADLLVQLAQVVNVGGSLPWATPLVLLQEAPKVDLGFVVLFCDQKLIWRKRKKTFL